ncbi:unnamed protein product [Discula destructiva]
MKCYTAQISSLVLAATAALAAPSARRGMLQNQSRAADSSCESYAEWDFSPYTAYHNNWGASSASSGSQCTTFDSASSWSTSWSWSGGSSSVKSYSNMAIMDVNKKLSDVSSIPSTWDWSYSGSDIVADVSYDLWLAPSAGADNTYEIMVWVAALGGAGPISSTGSAVATPQIAGSTWSLYSGTNGATTVLSFVAESSIESFSGDMMEFFQYLVDNEGVSDSLYITQLQAGTEPFTGTDAVFSTTSYSLSVE